MYPHISRIRLSNRPNQTSTCRKRSETTRALPNLQDDSSHLLESDYSTGFHLVESGKSTRVGAGTNEKDGVFLQPRASEREGGEAAYHFGGCGREGSGSCGGAPYPGVKLRRVAAAGGRRPAFMVRRPLRLGFTPSGVALGQCWAAFTGLGFVDRAKPAGWWPRCRCKYLLTVFYNKIC